MTGGEIVEGGIRLRALRQRDHAFHVEALQ